MQSKVAPNVFVIGDAANVSASKAGSVTHCEGETVVGNIQRFLAGESLEPGFDGHVNCFIESGFHKALLIDFNYDTEPLPGHFPTSIGLPLLKEWRLNHLGKLMFQGIGRPVRPGEERLHPAGQRHHHRRRVLRHRRRRSDHLHLSHATSTLVVRVPIFCPGMRTDLGRWQ
ncbi:MAG TPA: hypothetical protein VNG12_14975 [Acidimicrobiales bacterium]|nr:hypothetical protein [Acidimicrobiales bacterium]